MHFLSRMPELAEQRRARPASCVAPSSRSCGHAVWRREETCPKLPASVTKAGVINASVALTEVQYERMRRWAAGTFESDWQESGAVPAIATRLEDLAAHESARGIGPGGTGGLRRRRVLSRDRGWPDDAGPIHVCREHPVSHQSASAPGGIDGADGGTLAGRLLRVRAADRSRGQPRQSGERHGLVAGAAPGKRGPRRLRRRGLGVRDRRQTGDGRQVGRVGVRRQREGHRTDSSKPNARDRRRRIARG